MKPDASPDRRRNRWRRQLACGVVMALLGPGGAWTVRAGTAQVTAGMVVETCERAIAGGYRDMDAVMCDWHVRPCGVCGVGQVTPWCIPATRTPLDLAREVVLALKAADDLAGLAQPQVEKILRAHYPCAAQDGYPDQLVDP